jgi:tetratricopeptide (TPR) repeat protein
MNADWKELKNRASHFKIEKKYQEAAECLTAAIASSADAHPLDVGLLYNNLASIYFLSSQFALAEQAARKSLAIELEHGDAGTKTTNLADFYVMLSKTLEKQNRYCEAYQYGQQGLDIFVKLLGADNQFVKGVLEYIQNLKENSWKG